MIHSVHQPDGISTLTGRFDFVKYEDERVDQSRECPDPEGWDGENSLQPTFRIGCIMLVFRVAPDRENLKEGREFVLVREMELADRTANGPFPYLQCEGPATAPANSAELDYMYDDPDLEHKLGRLWTWAQRGSGGESEAVFAVVEVQNLLQTACLMPRWIGETDEWDVEHGVYENRTLLDSRRRPPFPKKCGCGLP